MTTLLDTSFAGADENPLSTPWANATGGHRKISNQVAVVNTSTFSVAVDNSNTYPADHEATVYVAVLGLRDFGPAVCINPANGECYFITNGSATDVWVYYYNGVGGFIQIGTIAGMVYAVNDAITLRREGTGLKVYQNGSQVGSTITDSTLSSGKAGISGYDNTTAPSTHRISRFIGADLNVGGPAITSTSSSTPQHRGTLTITGTDFQASQGAGFVTLGGISQAVTSWADTSITITVDRGTNKYGTQALVVTDNDAVPSNSVNHTLTPPDGWDYIDLGAPASSGRLRAYPDIVSGDQIAFETKGARVDVFVDATFVATAGVVSFEFEVWTTGQGWGYTATEYLEAPRDVRTQWTRLAQEIARRVRTRASAFRQGPAENGWQSTVIQKRFAEELNPPAGGSTPVTATFSLDAALQLARTATASLDTPIQAPQSTTTAISLAVQQALSAQASVDAALQLARTAAASIDTAVQAGRSASTSADLAIQAARTATTSADLAIQQARTATASIDTYVQAATQLAVSIDLLVQAGASLSVAVDVAIQAARSATSNVDVAVQLARSAAASVDLAVQQARSATASVDVAVQAARSAGVSIDLFVQAGFALATSLDTAVRFAASATATLDVAVALARSASFDVSTVVSVQRSVTAAMQAAVQASASAAASVNLYVYDPTAFTFTADSTRRIGPRTQRDTIERIGPRTLRARNQRIG